MMRQIAGKLQFIVCYECDEYTGDGFEVQPHHIKPAILTAINSLTL